MASKSKQKSEAAIVDEAIAKYTAWNRQRHDMTHEEYEEAVKYIYTSSDLPLPKRGYLVFKSISEAWKYVAKNTSENEREYQEKLKHPIQPVLGGVPCADLLAAIDVEEQVTGKPIEDPIISGFKALAKVGVFWALDEQCVFVETPDTYLNEQGQLHREDGPAIDYQGHDYQWFINDIRVDEQIVMRPQTQTLDDILNERNADKQAIRIERYGWLPFLGLIKAETLDERENLVEGTYEVLYATNWGKKFVALCPTGKIPVMGVPAHIATCEQAQKWLNGGVEFDFPLNIIGRT